MCDGLAQKDVMVLGKRHADGHEVQKFSLPSKRQLAAGMAEAGIKESTPHSPEELARYISTRTDLFGPRAQEYSSWLQQNAVSLQRFTSPEFTEGIKQCTHAGFEPTVGHAFRMLQFIVNIARSGRRFSIP